LRESYCRTSQCRPCAADEFFASVADRALDQLAAKLREPAHLNSGLEISIIDNHADRDWDGPFLRSMRRENTVGATDRDSWHPTRVVDRPSHPARNNAATHDA